MTSERIIFEHPLFRDNLGLRHPTGAGIPLGHCNKYFSGLKETNEKGVFDTIIYLGELMAMSNILGGNALTIKFITTFSRERIQDVEASHTDALGTAHLAKKHRGFFRGLRDRGKAQGRSLCREGGLHLQDT